MNRPRRAAWGLAVTGVAAGATFLGVGISAEMGDQPPSTPVAEANFAAAKKEAKKANVIRDAIKEALGPICAQTLWHTTINQTYEDFTDEQVARTVVDDPAQPCGDSYTETLANVDAMRQVFEDSFTAGQHVSIRQNELTQAKEWQPQDYRSAAERAALGVALFGLVGTGMLLVPDERRIQRG